MDLTLAPEMSEVFYSEAPDIIEEAKIRSGVFLNIEEAVDLGIRSILFVLFSLFVLLLGIYKYIKQFH